MSIAISCYCTEARPHRVVFTFKGWEEDQNHIPMFVKLWIERRGILKAKVNGPEIIVTGHDVTQLKPRRFALGAGARLIIEKYQDLDDGETSLDATIKLREAAWMMVHQVKVLAVSANNVTVDCGFDYVASYIAHWAGRRGSLSTVADITKVTFTGKDVVVEPRGARLGKGATLVFTAEGPVIKTHEAAPS